MSKLPSLLAFVCLSLTLLSCGETKTLNPTYSDSVAGARLPDFVVYVHSDLSSNFSQSLANGEQPDSTVVYYYTGSTNNLKNCALYGALVASVSGYHSGSATEANCINLATSLNQEGLFPVPQSELDRTGEAVKIGGSGFVYAYFFYSPNVTSPARGADVAANEAIPVNNRCFKLWAAQVQSGALVNSAGAAATGVDLKLLKCYGF